MSESTERMNSSDSGHEGHKSSSAGDVVKKPKPDLNHSGSNSTPHKNHSSSPLKKSSHSSSNSHHSNSVSKPNGSSSKPKDPNAIKKSHDGHKLKDGHRPKDGSSKPKVISNSSSPKPRPKDGSHSSSKPKDGSHSSSKSSSHSSSSSKPKDGSSKHSSSSSKPHISSKPKDGSHSSSKPHSSSSKPKDGSHSSSKPKDGSHSNSKHSSSSKPKDGSSEGTPKVKSSSDMKHKVSSSGDGSKSSSHKSSSSSHKDGSSKPKDPSMKPKDSSGKPRDPSQKPKDPSLKLKDPSKHSSSSSSSKHGSSSSSSKHSSSSSKPSSSSSSKHSSSSSSSKHSSSSSSKDKIKKEGGDKIKKEGGEKVTVKSELDSDFKQEKKVKAEPKSDTKVKDEPFEDIKPKKESLDKPIKKRPLEEDEDDEPLSKHDKVKEQKVDMKEEEESKKRKKEPEESDEDEDLRHDKVKKQKVEVKEEKESKKRKKEREESDEDEPLVKKKKDKKDKKKKDKGGEEKDKKKKKKKGEKEEEEVWKWWEEEPLPDGMKWRFLEHKGPVFAPVYEPLPDSVRFKYDGKVMKLSEPAEEVAGFYAKMLHHDYTTKEVFNKNFFGDWRKEMTPKEQKTIESLDKCNFKEMHRYFTAKAEERRNMSKEEKQKIKKTNEEISAEYGFCIMDNHKEKIGNFRIEPPGLFRGRGDHPKMGKLKKRITPKDVIINCSKDADVPEPPEGQRWKKVIHDNKVSWLCTWTENIQGQNKYIMLNPSSRLKGEKDWQKYETARKLKTLIGKIRENYREDFKSKEMRVRQRAVAMYFIDKLALRAGNEKEEGESADTVGCCSLRVEHVKLHDEKDGKEFVVEFDFLGKDSIRYQNSVPVEKRVFKNLKLFVENKAGKDDLFDRLNTSTLNEHLRNLMDNLTAKVFRTYNASITLQNQLKELTNEDDSVAAKELSYNRANRAVAILCNHQRAAPKTFDKQMSNLQEKIDKKHDDIKKAKKEYKALKSDYKSSRNEKIRSALERKKKQVERLEEQLMKLDVKATDKQENKEIALGTSKLNYLDPRISVAWCKKFEVPIEKVYNKTQREKFRWAIDMAGADFVF